MSTSNNRLNRARRRRLSLAIVTANGAGATSGVITQAVCSDPTIAVLVGTFVSGVVADGLLQVVGARNERDTYDDEHVAELDDGYGDLDREVVGQGRDEGQHGDGHVDARDDDVRELGAGHVGLGHRRHRGAAGHGYARCTEDEGHQHSARQLHVPARRRSQVTVPQNLRHRHLHRWGQRFVRRFHERTVGQQADRRRDAS
ncbi:hypothetical protein J8N05_46935 (plasmid) [Streptomyces sp. BH-SS-21]|uniref:Uncharacterized protein n=1 Tax=Streptomyces liliiviolaceus TaxID=2823109 RepID=A0A940Y4Z0_9ACTN|nr:hypothetical protein [Streptomyces liliiviolaceus]MBQ0855698.1 hypothetical protein [Streptomyces liliiviolaceus]